jgi:L-alanine-DL-glutamate epimerase-like enolase superfamily enzyme
LKIKDIRVYPLSVPRKRRTPQFIPVPAERNVMNSIHACFVVVETQEGLTGVGECTVREIPDAHTAIIKTLFRPLLIGSDPIENEVLWNSMFATLRTRGHNSGVFFEALAGVDCALWDLRGKYLHMPVHRLLGGSRTKKIRAYASSILFGEDPKGLAVKLVEMGHKQIKIKVGLGLDKDINNIKVIRDILGYSVELIADANSAYSTYDAIRLGRQLERYEVKWFEEPVAPDNLDGYVEVARTLDIPIAAGESHFSKYTFLDMMKRRAVDIIQPNVGRSGGITECKKILGMAEAFNLQYAPHTGLSGIGCRAASIHLASTVPDDIFLTYEYGIFSHPFGNYLLKSPVEIFQNGYVDVPFKDGLGLELDDSKLDYFHTGVVREWDDTRLVENTI